jgi:hypothetical protein
MGGSLAARIIQAAGREDSGQSAAVRVGPSVGPADKGTGRLVDSVGDSLSEAPGPQDVQAIEDLLVETVERYARGKGFSREMTAKAMARTRKSLSESLSGIIGEFAENLKAIKG